MRRFIIFLSLVLLLMSLVIGCGGGGDKSGSGDNNSGGGNTPPGSISGLITDVNGTGIDNATVTIIQTTTTATTEIDGSYNFTNVTPGNYVISVTADNFCTFSVAANVISGNNTAKNINLVSSTGLIAWFPLSGTMNDMIGNKIPSQIGGTPTSTVNHLGQPNDAYLFDGSSNYIYYPRIIENPTELTFSVWVKHLSAQLQKVYVFYHKNGADFNINFYDDPEPSVPYVSVKVDESTGYSNGGENVLIDWVNLTGVFKSNDKLQMYQNGTPKPERDFTGKSIHTGSSGGFTIGGESVSNGYFHGAIADIRIFNRVLSDSEIEALAQR